MEIKYNRLQELAGLVEQADVKEFLKVIKGFREFSKVKKSSRGIQFNVDARTAQKIFGDDESGGEFELFLDINKDGVGELAWGNDVSDSFYDKPIQTADELETALDQFIDMSRNTPWEDS